MRTRTLSIVLTTLILTVPVTAGADHPVPLPPDLAPRVDQILGPLSGMPAIVEDGSSLRVELAADPLAPVPDVIAVLRPSFGAVRTAVVLQQIGAPDPVVPSRLWPDRTVHAYAFAVPDIGGTFIEDLYDLEISGPTVTDRQPRAVKVVDAFPEEPTVAIIADPSVGDPRPIQEGAEDLVATGNAASLIDKTIKTIGNPMNEDRWAALGRAIDEINLMQPDLVVITGDLTFAIYPRPANLEYEDAHRILARLRVPAFLSPGNHDLYNLDYDDLDRPHTTDGWELWQQYFGPLYYAVDVGPDLRLVSLNTYDWPASQREPFDEDDEFSTRAGGQIQPEQFTWLTQQLADYRASNPDGSIVTFGHHDPSWIQRRHPWAGVNRLETRDLFAEHEVGVHFAGHTHEDRVARYHDGNIVETNGRRGTHPQLHYLLRNDQLDESWTQDDLGTIIRDPSNGPLFITTTTVSSVLKGSDWGLGSYWGWRYGTLRPIGTGYDPNDLGYPATREMLDALAERPENWDPAHAEYGVFSYPSYHLSVASDAPDGPAAQDFTIQLENDLLVPVSLEVPVSVVGNQIEADGGTVLRSRTDGSVTDAVIGVDVPAGGVAYVSVSGT